MSTQAHPAHEPPDDRSVDPFTTTAVALAAVALGGWAAALIAHAATRNAPNSAAVVLTTALAASASVCSVICLCASSLRHHQRRLGQAICSKIDAIYALHHQRPDADVELRAYLTGRMERDDGM